MLHVRISSVLYSVIGNIDICHNNSCFWGQQFSSYLLGVNYSECFIVRRGWHGHFIQGCRMYFISRKYVIVNILPGAFTVSYLSTCVEFNRLYSCFLKWFTKFVFKIRYTYFLSCSFVHMHNYKYIFRTLLLFTCYVHRI